VITRYRLGKQTSKVLPALCLMLVGCVPATGTYYRVSSSEGITRGYCSDIGPPVSLELKRGDAVIVIHDIRAPIKPYINQHWFSIDIFLHSKSDIVAVRWNQLRVLNYENGSELPVRIHVLSGKNPPGAGVPIQIQATLYGSIYSNYTIEYVFTGGISSRFYIEIPKMRVNGVDYPTLKVEYTKENGAFIRC
jgi:hypothetical protein